VGPDAGERINVDAPGTVNDATPVSPVLPVTVTVYSPLETPATEKDPDIEPPATLHSGLEVRPLGVEEIEHPVSPAAKFVPVTRTLVPTRPTVGNNVRAAVTVNVAVPTSRSGAPVRVNG
jgi:hypothetical protein